MVTDYPCFMLNIIQHVMLLWEECITIEHYILKCTSHIHVYDYHSMLKIIQHVQLMLRGLQENGQLFLKSLAF